MGYIVGSWQRKVVMRSAMGPHIGVMMGQRWKQLYIDPIHWA